jgi:ethanolamine utilization protein EutQ (cupin superfamily)
MSLCCHITSATAQQRGELQVTARVVASAPSREALADATRATRVDRASGLYVVRESGTALGPRRRDVGRPRHVVTIEYLAN